MTTTTCIIGYRSDDGVWIAGDSAATQNQLVISMRDKKVFHKDNMIMGGCGSLRMLGVLLHNLNIPRHPKGKSNEEYIGANFIQAVRKCFESAGFLSVESQREEGGEFLVGYKGELYYIGGDFGVLTSSEKYMAIGCGEHIGHGALYVAEKMNISTREKLQLAMEAVAHYVPGGVQPPFHFEFLPYQRRGEK